MKSKIKVADLAKALHGIETDRQLTKEIVEDALKEALTKAYRKHIEIPDAYVRVDVEMERFTFITSVWLLKKWKMMN